MEKQRPRARAGLIEGFRFRRSEGRSAEVAERDPAARAEALAVMRRAGRLLVVRQDRPPPPRRRAKEGQGDGGGFSARTLVSDYLKLCHDPVRDLRRWMMEDRKRPIRTGWRTPTATRRDTAHGHANTATRADDAGSHGLRHHALPRLRGGLDAHRREGRGGDRVSAGSRAGHGRYDQLRQVRAAGSVRATSIVRRIGGDAQARSAAFRGARSLLSSLYAARIEATRRSVSGREVAAAIRALLDERAAAFRTLTERRTAARIAARADRDAQRHGDRDDRRQGRWPPEVGPG